MNKICKKFVFFLSTLNSRKIDVFSLNKTILLIYLITRS